MGSVRSVNRRQNVEKQNKRKQLQAAQSDAILETRRALGESTDLGLVKSAIKRCENATTIFYSMLGQGVEVHRLQLIDSQGNVEDIFGPKGMTSELQSRLYQKEQDLVRQDKIDMETKKVLQGISKENLETEKLPELYVTQSGNNICDWFSKTEKKFLQVKKNNPTVMASFIYSLKMKSGPLKIQVQGKETIEEVYNVLVQNYVQGIQGLNRLYDLNNIKGSTALDSRICYSNIELFEKRTAVIQKLKVMKNATNELVQTLAEWMFLYQDMQDWNKFRAKQARVKDCESVTEKRLQKIDQSMIDDDSFDPLTH